jgi:hypothetical protein
MDFSQVEAEYARLKGQFEAGNLTEEQFKSQLHDLMLQDEGGEWWIIGYETGQWYRHDGTDWVRADPPGHVQPDMPPPPVSSPEHVLSKPALQLAAGGLMNWYAAGLVTIGWGITWGITLSLPWLFNLIYLIDEGGLGILAFLCGTLSGLVCGLALRWTSPAIRWLHILLIAAGWAIGLSVFLNFIWEVVVWERSIEINEIIVLIITGLIGGSATGLALKWAKPLTDWRYVFIIAGGWALAITIGFILSPKYFLSSELSSIFARFTVTGLMIGAIGSGIMFWQLGQLKKAD